MFHQRLISGLRRLESGFGLLVLLLGDRFFFQQPLESVIILFQLPKLGFSLGDVGVLYGDVRMGGLDTGTKYVL